MTQQLFVFVKFRQVLTWLEIPCSIVFELFCLFVCLFVFMTCIFVQHHYQSVVHTYSNVHTYVISCEGGAREVLMYDSPCVFKLKLSSFWMFLKDQGGSGKVQSNFREGSGKVPESFWIFSSEQLTRTSPSQCLFIIKSAEGKL